MDVIEDPIFKNIIIAQTVLQESKRHSVSCYQRLIQLFNSPNRHFFILLMNFTS